MEEEMEEEIEPLDFEKGYLFVTRWPKGQAGWDTRVLHY